MLETSTGSAPLRILPADPGTVVLELTGLGEEPEIVASPVIAWYAEPEGVVPVTIRGRHDGIGDLDYVVEFPGGQVIAPTIGTWPSREAYLTGMGVRAGLVQLNLDLRSAA